MPNRYEKVHRNIFETMKVLWSSGRPRWGGNQTKDDFAKLTSTLVKYCTAKQHRYNFYYGNNETKRDTQ